MVRELRGLKREYQHPSWRMSGHVSPAVMDHDANLYMVPVPTISLDINPVAKRNVIYKINAHTAQMSEFMFTDKVPGSNKHPYGNVGITYDCDTRYLYVSNVARSGPYKQSGLIYQIDPVNKQIISRLNDVDAIGLGIFNYQGQKRLYYGSARNSGLYSVGLGNQGDILSDQRYELSLAELPEGDTTSIKKNVFSKGSRGRHIMTLSETKFGFRLVGETAYQIKKYHFSFDTVARRWRYLGVVWD